MMWEEEDPKKRETMTPEMAIDLDLESSFFLSSSLPLDDVNDVNDVNDRVY